MLKCPECGSQRIWKDGLRYLPDGTGIQRFLCRICHYRFSESSVNVDVTCQSGESSNHIPDSGDVHTVDLLATQKRFDDFRLSFGEDVGSQGVESSSVPTVRKHLNNSHPYSKDTEYCVTEVEGTKNLVGVEPVKGGLSRAVTEVDIAEVKGKLVEFAWHLQRKGRTEATIKTFTSLLTRIVNLNANLFDPESVKDVLAKHEIHRNTKASMTTAYSSFLRFLGKSWEKPNYRYQPKIPFIPLEKEISDLIAGCSRRTGTLLQLLKETGMRIGEALRLKWIDVNIESRTVSVNSPEKNSNPRLLSVSPKMVGMLEALPRSSDKVFGDATKQCRSHLFKTQRERLAIKLNNPRLRKITFHTLRHWKATIEYHKTKDIIHVQQLLGHKSIQSTLIYINLEKALFKTENDQFITKVAHTPEEARKLREVGFEKFDEFDGMHLYCKRK